MQMYRCLFYTEAGENILKTWFAGFKYPLEITPKVLVKWLNGSGLSTN